MEAISMGRQTRLEITMFVWQMSRTFRKTLFLKTMIHELETLGTRQRILWKKVKECSCAGKRPVALKTTYPFDSFYQR